MNFRIANPLTNGLARLSGDEKMVKKTTASGFLFNLSRSVAGGSENLMSLKMELK